MLTRREIGLGAMGVGVGVGVGGVALGQPASIVEQLSGDPDLPKIVSTFPARTPILDNSTAPLGLTYIKPILKDKAALAAEFVITAKSYAARGVDAAHDGPEIENWLKLFGINPRAPSGDLLAFCAAGLSWSICEAYANLNPKIRMGKSERPDYYEGILRVINTLYFYPNCSVYKMKQKAQERNIWVSDKSVTLKQGWPIVYDWDGDGKPDHIGIVSQRVPSGVETVEFNTRIEDGGNQSNGGHVAVRHRALDQVMGFIAWY